MPYAEWMQAMLLGVVQGITEFLPISSSGHLVILQGPLGEWLGTQSEATEHLQLNVAVHLGTLFSILLVYRSDLMGLWKRPRLCAAIVAATLPVVVVGLTLKDAIESAFDDPIVAGAGLLVTAGLLLAGQRWERGVTALEDISWKSALAVGLFQAVAIVPGISRSGSTIAGGLLVGFRRESAAGFSFLIAVPAIAGAAVLVAKDIWQQGQGNTAAIGPLLLGALTAFVVGYFALRWLLKLVAAGKLHWFAGYCVAVAAATIAVQLFAVVE